MTTKTKLGNKVATFASRGAGYYWYNLVAFVNPNSIVVQEVGVRGCNEAIFQAKHYTRNGNANVVYKGILLGKDVVAFVNAGKPGQKTVSYINVYEDLTVPAHTKQLTLNMVSAPEVETIKA